MALTGIVLAGGASRRLGTDKATLVVDGERLVDRAVNRLGVICERVIVASGSRHIGGLSTEQVRDVAPGKGPLGGLIAGLEAAGTPLVAVLAVDVLHADPATFIELARRWEGEGAVIPVVDGEAQPLHAVWSAAVAPKLRRRVGAGLLRVIDAAEEVGACFVEDRWPVRLNVNVNRPEDLSEEEREQRQ